MFLVISALGPPPLGPWVLGLIQHTCTIRHMYVFLYLCFPWVLGAGLAWANPKLFSVFGGSGELASLIILNVLVAGMVPNRISVSWIKTGGLGWGLERFGDVLERSWIGPERSRGVSGPKNLKKLTSYF